MIVNPNGSPISSSWRNGVKETSLQGATSYELPTDTVGVAQEITVTPRFFGLLGSTVTASDGHGNSLETSTAWHGLHRVFVTEDPTTGLRTELDPKERTVAAGTPKETRVDSRLGNLQVNRWQQQVWQRVDSDGNLTVTSAAQGQQKEARLKHVPVVLMKEESFIETRVPVAGAVVSEHVKVTEKGCEHGAPLAATLNDGEVTLTRADGSSLAVPLYFGPGR